MNGRA